MRQFGESEANFDQGQIQELSMAELKLPLKSSKTIGAPSHRDDFSLSLTEEPCLVVNERTWVLGFLEIYSKLQDVLSETTPLLLVDHREEALKMVETVQSVIDPCVEKILFFVHNFAGQGVEDECSFSVDSAKQRKFEKNIKKLYNLLEVFEKAQLTHQAFLGGKAFGLSDLTLFTSLDKMYRFFFDSRVAKSWLPNLTRWFIECAALPETIQFFGNFKLCRVSLLQLFERAAVDQHREATPASLPEPLSLPELRTRLRAVRALRIGVDPEDSQLEVEFETLRLEELHDLDLFAWRFKLLLDGSANKDSFLRAPADDEVEVFRGQLTEALKSPSEEFLVYLALFSKCEEVGNKFGLRRGEAETCPRHEGNVFQRRNALGFCLSRHSELPAVLSGLEAKDLIEVTPEEDIHKLLEDVFLNCVSRLDMERIYFENFF